MPLHDWTRVDAGVFHDFHNARISELRRVLNGGLPPDGYYALGEQVAGAGNPDVLALQERNGHDAPQAPDESGGIARLVTRAEREVYTDKKRRVTIRHKSGDRIVAMIEIVSSGNKASEYAFQSVLDIALAAVDGGIHLLVLDLFPPTPRDPHGFRAAFWGQYTGEQYEPPAGLDRTLAAYSSGYEKTAYVEPVAVGATLREMPLFLTPDGIGYIGVPLEATYAAAFDPVPKKYKALLAPA
jgi:hypothetical protein